MNWRLLLLSIRTPIPKKKKQNCIENTPIFDAKSGVVSAGETFRRLYVAFRCSACGFDFSVRMDLLALAIKADYAEEGYPKELSLDGTCESCGASFNYGGEFFTHYMKTKVEEGVINPATSDYAIVALNVSEEEHDEFKRLTELGDQKKIDAFIQKLMSDSKQRKPNK